MPNSCASSNENVLPVIISSMALLFPTRRDRRCVPPVPGKHAEVDFGQADLARVFAGDPEVGRHGDLQPSANAMAVDRGDHELRRVLQPQQCFVCVQAEVILERRIDRGQHLDVRASGEKLVAHAGEHDHVHIVIHARPEDGLVELAVHFVGVGVRRRIVHLDHGHAGVGAIVDELLGGFAGGRLRRRYCCHRLLLIVFASTFCEVCCRARFR